MSVPEPAYQVAVFVVEPSAEGEGRRPGHRDRLVEGDRELDVLARAVGVRRLLRHRGHRHPRHPEVVVLDGDRGRAARRPSHVPEPDGAIEAERELTDRRRNREVEPLVGLDVAVVHRRHRHRNRRGESRFIGLPVGRLHRQGEGHIRVVVAGLRGIAHADQGDVIVIARLRHARRRCAASPWRSRPRPRSPCRRPRPTSR